jgi:hypothetical protein
VVGTLLSVAITLVAGAAVWGFVNQQAGASATSYANNVAATDNFLNEQFKIVDMSFPAVGTCPGSNSAYCLSFWIYNTGNVVFQPASVRLYDSAKAINIIFYSKCPTGSTANCVVDLLSSPVCTIAASTYESTTMSSFSLKQTNLQYLTLTIPPTQTQQVCTSDPSFGQAMSSGTTYSVTLTGVYGNSLTYYMLHP